MCVINDKNDKKPANDDQQYNRLQRTTVRRNKLQFGENKFNVYFKNKYESEHIELLMLARCKRANVTQQRYDIQPNYVDFERIVSATTMITITNRHEDERVAIRAAIAMPTHIDRS